MPLPEIHGYSALELLGEGGFATVYSARGVEHGSEVALKVFRAGFQDRLAREAQAMRRLGPPHSPHLLGEERTRSGEAVLVMERLWGQTLADCLVGSPEGALAPRETARIFRPLCSAVEAMHRAGIAHGDLKPENVFLCEAPVGSGVTLTLRPSGGGQSEETVAGGPRLPMRVALLDFGVCRLLEDLPLPANSRRASRIGERPGTPAYMAPEQWRAQDRIGTTADFYALGVMLFELLAGRPPFVGEDARVEHAHLLLEPPAPSEVAAAMGLAPSPSLDEVVLACLAKDPVRRPVSAIEIADRLDAAFEVRASGHSSSSRPTARATKSQGWAGLLAFTAHGPLETMVEMLALEGGVVARAEGERAVVAFTKVATPEAGVRSALRAARRLGPLATAATIHTAEVRVRTGNRGTQVLGTAIDGFRDWCPSEPPIAPICLTSEAAAHCREQTTALDQEARFHAPLSTHGDSGSTRTASLQGRDALLSRLKDEAVAAWTHGSPALSTVVGDSRLGKTRLLAELRGSLKDQCVLLAPGLAAPRAGREDMLREAVSLALGLRPTAGIDEVRRTCASALGPELDAAWPAVALAMGLSDEGTLGQARPVDAPGALRHSLARAIAAGLRRLAEREPVGLLLDDAESSDAALLDAVELATMGGPRRPLWICVCARAELRALRPSWGERARVAHSHQMAPLEEADARTLLLELIQPVEFLAEPVVKRLLESTQRVPGLLVDLVEALKAAGAIRRLAGAEAWHLPVEELNNLSAIASPADRLADITLGGLTPLLVELAQLCAVLADPLHLDEVERVQRFLRAKDGGERLDVEVGLSRLAQRRVLRRTGNGHFELPNPMLRLAIERRTPADLRRRLHVAAFHGLAGRRPLTGSELARLSRHASECGEQRAAAMGYLQLGDDARRRHRYVEAEAHYTSALAHLPPGEQTLRCQAWSGRGGVRYRLWRMEEALEDVRAARRIAESQADAALTADLLLEEATLLDWSFDWAGSQRAAAQAEAVAQPLGDPRLAARCLLARGRALVRSERFSECVGPLRAAADQAAALGDHEARVISLLLLSPSLAVLERIDQSERTFEEVIDLCERTGDRFHLCTAYGNRVLLWQRKDRHRGLEDLRRAVELARELGHAQLERTAQLNLAELLLWSDELAQALIAARRARELELRFYGRHPPDDALLVGRILAAEGERSEIRPLLDFVAAHCTLSPSNHLWARMLELCLANPAEDAAWKDLVRSARESGFSSDALVEVLCHAADAAPLWGRRAAAASFLGEALEAASELPHWGKRLDLLRIRIEKG